MPFCKKYNYIIRNIWMELLHFYKSINLTSESGIIINLVSSTVVGHFAHNLKM
jgi:hypothetical protein